MISNYISLITCFLELFFYGGIFLGWSFLRKLFDSLKILRKTLEPIFERESILWKEKCQAFGEAQVSFIFIGCVQKLIQQIPCEDAKEFYNFIFTCSVIASASGAVIIGIIEVKVGQFFNRLACNFMTTAGSVCLTFYKESGYLLLAGWILMAFPSVYYIVSNVWLASGTVAEPFW